MRLVHISHLASIALCGLLEHQCKIKIIQSMLERVQICRRCWKTNECAGAEGQQTTAEDKQGTHHEQLSLNIKTVVDHSGNDKVLRFKGM